MFLETLITLLLAQQPFGPVPFTVAPIGPTQAEVGLLMDPPRTLIINDQFEVISMNGEEATCQEESEI